VRIGAISNNYIVPSIGQVNPRTYAPPGANAPVQDTLMSPIAGLMPGQGDYMLFLSPDGDRAEISTNLLSAMEPQGVCHTCENRRYIDKSDDASVSFQTPTKINANMSAAVVAAHENEHVRNEQARAHRDGRDIINQTVSLTYDTCPECGKHYVSGGTTKTTSISRSESEDDGMSFEDVAPKWEAPNQEMPQGETSED